MYFSSDQGETFSRALLPSASTEQVKRRDFNTETETVGASFVWYFTGKNEILNPAPAQERHSC